MLDLSSIYSAKAVRNGFTSCLIAILALAWLTVACYQLHLNLATASLLYVVVVVLASRLGGFVLSVVVSVIATLGLGYLAPPADSFRIDDPLDVVAVATFLIASLVIARLVSKLDELANEVRSSVNRRLIESEERERSRIAKELNDNINQRMALLAVNLERLRQNPPASSYRLKQEIGHVSEQVDELAADIQDVSYRLYSSNLEYVGLAKAAAGFCREFASRQGLEIQFRSEDIPTEMSRETALCLFRVLQEALQNATMHSGSREIQVSLARRGAEIELTVHDSGVGFDPEKSMKGPGLGLISIRERLKLVSGHFSIDSQPRHGTKVQARVPLRPARSPEAALLHGITIPDC
jgi:signal transduction histidine kinase